MKVFEIGLLVLGAAWFLICRLGVQRNWAVAGSTLVVSALVLGLQLGVEGPRWELGCAYVLAVNALLSALFTVTRERTVPDRRSPRMHPFRTVGHGLFLVVAVLIPVWLFPVVEFEPPSGPYAVGAVGEFWIDSTRSENLTSDPNDVRELLVQLWYPAEVPIGAATEPYRPDPDEFAQSQAATTTVAPFAFKSLAAAKTHTVAGAKLASHVQRFPLLLFSHGYGGHRFQNTFQFEELASHGFIVASIEHSYSATGTIFPDGRPAPFDTSAVNSPEREIEMVHRWSEDARFVLDRLVVLNARDPEGRFTGRIDLSRVGYFGHSFGGASVVETLAKDSRFKAGIDMDGFPFGDGWKSAFPQPMLEFRSGPIDIEKLSDRQIAAEHTTRPKLRELYAEFGRRGEALLANGGVQAVLDGAAHSDFSDLPLWSPPLTRLAHLHGPGEPRRLHHIINAYTLAFFDHALRGEPTQLLAGPSPDYPDVHVRVGRRAAPVIQEPHKP